MNQPNQPAQVQDKAPKPQGLLPKNVQSWLLIGLAFLMVAIMWLTGGKKPQTASQSSVARHSGPGTARSQRNQDCRNAEPHSGIAAPATCRADRSYPADSLARCRPARFASNPSSRARPVSQPTSERRTPFRRSGRDVPTCRCLLRMSL